MIQIEAEGKFISIESLFGYFFAKTANLKRPFSVAEMNLDIEEVNGLKQWARGLRGEVKDWFNPIENKWETSKEYFTLKEMFGFLLILISAESCRDFCTEESIWPTVRNMFSEKAGLRNWLFPGGQPSKECKTSIEDGAKKVGLRNVIQFAGTQEYFDTIKLQFGFTFKGGQNRLPQWLAGLGVPFAVKLLNGDANNLELESKSFKYLWDSLKDYQHNKISDTGLKIVLKESVWVKASWIDDLISALNQKVESLSEGSDDAGESAVLQKIFLNNDQNTFRLKIKCSKDLIEECAKNTETSQLIFEVDGKIVERWNRQDENSFTGNDEIFCDLESLKNKPNLRPKLLKILHEDRHALIEVDLEKMGLCEDVMVFESNTGQFIDFEEVLSDSKSYFVICDDILDFKNGNYDLLKKVSGRKIFKMSPPYDSGNGLYLSESIYWEPEFKKTEKKTPLKINLENPDNLPLKLGSESLLKLSGIPENTIDSILFVGNKQFQLRKLNAEEWITDKKVLIKTNLLTKTVRVRIRLEDGNEKKNFHRVKINLVANGLAIRQDENETEDGAGWQELPISATLNIYGRMTKCKLFLENENDGFLLEGFRPLGKLSKKVLHSSDLSGWGEKLVFNDDEQLVLNDSVQDDGLLKYVLPRAFGGQKPFIQLNYAIDDIENYGLLYFVRDQREGLIYGHGEIGDKINDYKWQVTVPESAIAICLTYEGRCLGSYKNLALSNSYYSRKDQFALLRWLKAPVLSTDYLHKFFENAYSKPIDFYFSWLFDEGLPDGFGHSVSTAEKIGRESILRRFLWNWNPYDGQVKQVIKKYESVSAGSNEVEIYYSISQLSPLFLYRVINRLNVKRKIAERLLRRIFNLQTIVTGVELENCVYDKRKELERLFKTDKGTIDQSFSELWLFLKSKNTINPIHENRLRVMMETDIGRKYFSGKILQEYIRTN